MSLSFDPIAVAHPARLAAPLDLRLGPELVQRLRGCRRLRPRLLTIVVAPPVEPGGDGEGSGDGALSARLAASDPMDLARLAGAAWHGNALKHLIAGKTVAELVRRIGPRARAFGLRNAALAVPAEPAAADGAALAELIERDGLRCLGAFLLRVPAGLRTQTLFRLPPGSPAERPEAEDPDLSRAPAIMARVLAEPDEDGAEAARPPAEPARPPAEPARRSSGAA